jgi:hypothetical protein
VAHGTAWGWVGGRVEKAAQRALRLINSHLRYCLSLSLSVWSRRREPQDAHANHEPTNIVESGSKVKAESSPESAETHSI